MDEASKSKKYWTQKEFDFLKGDGIDIGCGNDPILPHVTPFDQIHGDANKISLHVNKSFDFVFSCHALEHMLDPRNALKEWCKILKPGGILFLIVPDEDLYEQGNWPSRYNTDHKWSFTISKRRSWSPKSINLLNLTKELGLELISLELQDNNFDYQIYHHNNGKTRGAWWSHRLWRWFKKISKPFRGSKIEVLLSRFYSAFGSNFDQTWMGGDRLAQIQLIARKMV
jgi:SAM-dependent methyltransferase